MDDFLQPFGKYSIVDRLEYWMVYCKIPQTTCRIYATIVQSKRVSEEYGSTFAVITYDLAIAKIAKKIQNEEPDK